MNKLLIKIREFDAHGGPSQKIQGVNDKYAATPTTPGRYVIKTIEKHISTSRYSAYSGLPWGAGLKIINKVVYVDRDNNGRWLKLTSVLPVWKSLKSEDAVTADILDYWRRLTYAHSASGDVWLYGSSQPDRWLFSDFGHISIKYFADRNHNGIMDKGETVMGDFIHTTPNDEAVTYYNKNAHGNATRYQVNLAESHGCIHVKPADVDVMIGSNYLKKGQGIVVHKYDDKIMPSSLKPDQYTRPGFEVHFFPGLFKIAVYKVT
jgi:hypothetical protein